MNILDVFLCLVFGWGLWKGWKSGLLKEAASLGGFIIGLFIARICYGILGDYLAPRLGTSPTMANIFAFIFLWVAVPIALGILARFFTRIAKDTPFGGLNRLGGACISFIKYALLLSCMLNIMAFIHMVDDEKQTDESLLYTPTKSFVGWTFKALVRSNDAKKGTSTDSTSVQKPYSGDSEE
jgi:membrane protein required for colicin V production